MKQIILTGDRPTGNLHVGHYVGSLAERVKLQNSGKYDEIYIMIADAQALTDNAEHPERVRQNIMKVALDYLAVGIDPEKANIFIQSMVPQLTELTFYYMNLVTVSRVQRNPTVKAEIQMRNFEASIPVGMTRKGYSCGVLDADITGPSIPKTFGVHGQLEGCEEGILPARSEGGVQMISINLVLPHEDDPVIYRGPIIAETVKQFWSDVVWDDVDFLFVDMPPGTGDVPLTVFQSLPVDGIIVVTSPQDLVSMIVGKAVKMAKMMNIPVLGIVENYSYLACPDCGKHISVFGESHIDEVGAPYELPVLAKLPIDPKLAAAVDAGKIEDAKLPDELSGALKTVEGLL